MPGLTHFVSLQGPAGVERHFAELALQIAARHPDWTQRWLNPDRGIHATLRATLGSVFAGTALAKYRWGLKLPAKPDAIRAWHCRRELAATDVLLLWNRTARLGFVVDAMGPERCIHWEHGSAWHPGRERERERYLRRVPFAIANSRASARVLELMWGYAGETRVCLNALRPSLMPSAPAAKAYPVGRAIRLGAAARLMPVKGLAVVIHAVAALRASGMDVELHVAGTGGERERLETLAAAVGIASAIRFYGLVDDMRSFYAAVDCLLHVPLTEAFGLVAIEAAAQGCPAIVAAVDGLPEAIEHNVSGRCLEPTLPLSDYAALAGADYGIPDHIYDPAGDALAAPKAVDPGVLAAAVRSLFADAPTYERLSCSASEHMLTARRFDQHVDEVMDVVSGVAAS